MDKMCDRAKHFMKEHAYRSIPVNFEEAYDIGAYALKGCSGDALAQIQSVVILSALHNVNTYAWKWNRLAEKKHGHSLPKSAAEQIAGVCASIFEIDIENSKFGFIRPNIDFAMDNCGMGGDLITTANVSTLAAIVASAGGVYMCKHGSPANADAGRHGSSDFITMLGIDKFAHKNRILKCLESERFAFTEALDVRYKRIHLQTHDFAMMPHMNDIIGPITNPLDPKILKRRVLGVNHLVSPKVVAEVYKILNKRGITKLEHGLFIRGYVDKSGCGGMDELSICEGGTLVAELRGDEIKEYWLSADSFGLKPVSQESISPPSGKSKGHFSFEILHGKVRGAPLEMILASAALLFYLDGQSDDLKKCYRIAKDVFRSGAPSQKVLAVKKWLSL